MMRFIVNLLILFLIRCSPKGPQTYASQLVGKTQQELVKTKGKATEIKIFGTNKAYIYRVREDYFGKKKNITPASKPKKSVIIEDIYYVNEKQIVYKFQVWKKKVK